MRRLETLGPDAIGSLFGSPPTSADDEGAATALALAFVGLNGGGAEGAPVVAESREIVGAPARPAATELSLDSVFGGGQSGAAPSSFSFDQFFSQRASSEHSPGSAGAQSAGEDSGNDVAQFTQWLEGLKQR
jgi:hypothetical protein